MADSDNQTEKSQADPDRCPSTEKEHGHFFVALFITSLVVILHELGFLNGLDNFFWRFASASASYMVISEQNHSAPVVVGIGDIYFEREFNQASPLNRGELKEILETIVATNPGVVAIDLDLSPGPNAESENEAINCAINNYTAAESELYNYLLREKLEDWGLVLQLPFPVYNYCLRQRKLHWMQQMCGAGIEFGRVTFDSSLGMVAKIHYGPGRLSLSVHRMKNESIGNNNSGPICKMLRAYNYQGNGFQEAERLLMPFVSEPVCPDRIKPINFNFFRNFTLLEINTSDDILADLPGDVVFLGGVYGDSDRFNTPAGRIPGVILMAADYYSLVYPMPDHPIIKLIVFIFEVFLGTVLGPKFENWWRWYLSRKTRGPPAVANLLACSLFSLGICSVLAILSFGTLFIPLTLWLNPAPIVFGMFFEVIIASSHSPLKTKKRTCQSFMETLSHLLSPLPKKEKYQPISTSRRDDVLFVIAIALYWIVVLIATYILIYPYISFWDNCYRNPFF